MPAPAPVPDHEKLDVYVAAIDFVALADKVVERLPRGRAYLTDQLQRAARSIALNIAEGAGEFSTNDKARFYRIAKRSATESAAILHVCDRLELVDPARDQAGRELLLLSWRCLSRWSGESRDRARARARNEGMLQGLGAISRFAPDLPGARGQSRILSVLRYY